VRRKIFRHQSVIKFTNLRDFRVRGVFLKVFLNDDDPTKSLTERNAIRKKSRFNPYFKDRFEIAKVVPGEGETGKRRYILEDFPDLKFKPTKLQKVKTSFH
jgi:hypothetical protein